MVAKNKELHSYTLLPNTFAMDIGSKLSFVKHNGLVHETIPIVKAGSLLRQYSYSDIIDYSKFSQNISNFVQNIDIVEVAGRLHCTSNISFSYWLKIVSLARDCHSCNSLLMTTENGIVLRTIRPIFPGEPLYMWFAEDILDVLKIPSLDNKNIKGFDGYICHLCNYYFEFPNPLRIHLVLKCNRLHINHLWAQLAKKILSMTSSSEASNLYPKLPIIQIINSSRILPMPSLNNKGNIIDLSLNLPAPAVSVSPKQNSTPLPVIVSCYSTSQPMPKSSLQLSATATPYIGTPNFAAIAASQSTVHPHHAQQPPPEIFADNPKDVETYFSNCGKVGNKHRCFYCGKFYSRKYGLKIHIRTHTKFKPLRCKICLRSFGDPSNLNKHVRLHSETDTSYKCQICSKILVRKRDLERHMKSRHDKITDSDADDVINVVDV